MPNTMDNSGALLLNHIGVWIGFFFSLMILSAIIHDNVLSRLSQHILVGAGLGYAVILAIQYVLRPFLFTPLFDSPAPDPLLWIPMALGILLFVAGLDRTVIQGTPADPLHSPWRRGFQGLARLPVALMLGIGFGVAIFGALQGTFVPQYWRAAQLAFDRSAPLHLWLPGALTLFITTATLLYLYVDPERYLAQQPIHVRRLMLGWMWLGQRAMWVAAGLIFARLVAARLSLLIARFEFFFNILYGAKFGDWIQSIWQNLGR